MPLIAEVASVNLRIGRSLGSGRGNVEALVAGWTAAGEIGRHWLMETVREFAGRRACTGLVAAIESVPVAEVHGPPFRRGW